LPQAHSWYKQLPLKGSRFVVFVAPDAGLGQLVAVPRNYNSSGVPTEFSLVTPPEGPEFTDATPRLHHSWKTTKEYRTRFGYLDYSHWQDSEGLYSRDAGPPIPLPAELEERCGFVLYPYVSEVFTEAIAWPIHERAVAELQAGAEHSARAEVLKLTRLGKAIRLAFDKLSEADRKLLFSDGSEKKTSREPSAELSRYLEFDRRQKEIARSLRHQENDKIRRALTALDDWLLRGGS